MKIKIATLSLMMVLCMSFGSVTAFAKGSEDTKPEQPTATEEVENKTPVALTPEGNLTLVDDVKGTDPSEKQFITMQSKNGNYFYLVIDRAGDEENVYFLNLVDEADLLALVEELPPVEPTTPVEPVPPTETTSPEQTTPPSIETQGSPIAILGLLGVIVLMGGGALYYFKIMKPKQTKKSTTNIDDFEYDDEEETDEEEYGFDFDDASDEEIEEELND